MKQVYLFIILLFGSFSAKGQAENLHCGTDQLTQQLFQQHPELQSGMINATNQLEQFTQDYISNSHETRSNDPYVIPVVFHIIHDYGEGNISDEQVFDAVKQVNMQYRKQNEDTSEIVNEFKGMAADTEIEIKLAKKDPNGNCTNGITRTYSPLTNTGGHVVKDLIHWPSDQYLNIYVCNYVGAGLAGHCLLPGAADTIPEWDGIVILHSSLGSIGTSSPAKKTVLTHEIGHFLNLQHIWGGNNVPGFYYLEVGNSQNCNHDDGVADTPNTIGWSSCNLTGSTCDTTLDMVQNYMDYSYCSVMFTEGQKQRMHAALNSTVANRNNLWSNGNLTATGVIGGNDLCKVVPKASTTIICEGESIDFSDLSYHGVTSRNWTFQGGDINSSTDSTATVTYNTTGTYDVQLSISDGNQTIDTLLTDYIQVLPVQPSDNQLIESFEDMPAFNNKWSIIPSSNPTQFEITNYGQNSDHSIYVDNFNGPEIGKYSFQSFPFDASEYNDFAITFDFAYAKISTNVNEEIYIQLSKDCGKSWATKRSLPLSIYYSTLSDNEFFPSHDSLWNHQEYTFPLGNFEVENLMVRFLFKGDGGNNIFIDNIKISNSTTLDLVSNSMNNSLKVHPNPAKSTLNITMEKEKINGGLQLYDVYGKSIYSLNSISHQQVKIDLSSFSEGTYFLHYTPTDTKQRAAIQKIVIAR